MNQQVLTATAAFQCLVQCSADVIERREDGERLGLIAKWMDVDEAIAVVLARLIFQKYDRHFSPAMMASVLQLYCRDDIFHSFLNFYEQFAADAAIDISQLKHSLEAIQGLMDIGQLAQQGRKLGWRQSWGSCFKSPFLEEWYAAFPR